ncbi:MAG: hypothetical protein DBX42_08270 [Azospirillum sp.]|nr:MAG: hypothetical protein DBX42_08270 [Azospirillum sp.]
MKSPENSVFSIAHDFGIVNQNMRPQPSLLSKKRFFGRFPGSEMQKSIDNGAGEEFIKPHVFIFVSIELLTLKNFQRWKKYRFLTLRKPQKWLKSTWQECI